MAIRLDDRWLRPQASKMVRWPLLAALSLSACQHNSPTESAKASAPAKADVYALSARTLEGQPAPLAQYRGKVTLLVNVASECGYTPQYAGLQQLHERYEPKGFSVLGFPSNDFGRQEPGSAQDIRAFCSSKYRVKFPMFEKVQALAGSGQSPIYALLAQGTGTLPQWNFGKYLVSRSGKVLKFFPSDAKPESPELASAIEAALAESA